MTNERELDKPARYRIRVGGNLDQKWSDWFDGFSITPHGDDETVLTGSVVDQSALHGMLGKIRDLGLPILLIEREQLAEDTQ